MTEPITTEEFHRQEAKHWLEETLRLRVTELAHELGWKTYHTHDSRRSDPGWPDVAFVHPTRHRFMVRELKTMRGTVTADQTKWLEWLRNSGIDVGVWRPIDYLNQTVHHELMT